MNKRFSLKTFVCMSLIVSSLGSTTAWAQGFNTGSLAGGILGGVIAGAMMSNAQRQPTVVYGRRVYYRDRAAPRRHFVHHVAPSGPARSAVVDPAADPFATKAGGLTSISTKP